MTTKHILLALDGSGSKDWSRLDGLNSHVFRFFRDFQGEQGKYKFFLDGPTTAGTDVGLITSQAMQHIYTMLANAKREGFSLRDVRINLVGHSRGGFIAVKVANMLANPFDFLRVTSADSRDRVDFLTRKLGSDALEAIKINFIGLYDAVERTGEWGGDIRLPNVSSIAHAIRPRYKTRVFFGGIDIDVPHAVKHVFNTSHGGVGGDPGFFNSLQVGNDVYCYARHLIEKTSLISEIGQRYLHPVDAAYGDFWAAKKNTIDDIKTFWQDSINADLFIRKEAQTKDVPLIRTSPHYPYTDQELGKKLQAMVGL